MVDREGDAASGETFMAEHLGRASAYVWSCDTFKAIALVFGKVLEVEDWTEEKEQTFLGRVLVLSNSTIGETLRLTATG